MLVGILTTLVVREPDHADAGRQLPVGQNGRIVIAFLLAAAVFVGFYAVTTGIAATNSWQRGM